MKEEMLWIGIILFYLALLLFIIRIISPKELDDVSPEIPCEEKLLQKADILWIIPKFNNNSISKNPEWCKKILNLNKTLGLHGFTHEFEEFKKDRSAKYIEEAINEFQKCFGFKPKLFKPPYLKISKSNKEIIKSKNMKIKSIIDSIFHKVYHCNNSMRNNLRVEIF